MSNIAKIMKQAAAGVIKTVDANLGTRSTFTQDYDADATAITRVGTSNYYAMVQYDTQSKHGRIYIIYYNPSNSSFTLISNNAAWTAWSTDQYASIVDDHANSGRVACIAQTNTFYPSIFSFKVNTSNGAYSSTENYQISNDSDYGQTSNSNNIIKTSSGILAMFHEQNGQWRPYEISLSSGGLNSKSFGTGIGTPTLNRSDYTAFLYSSDIDRFYIFWKHSSTGQIRWGSFSYNFSNGSYGHQDGATVYTPSSNSNIEGVRGVSLETTGGADKLFIVYERGYNNGRQYRAQTLTPYLDGNNYGKYTNSSTKNFDYSDLNSISGASWSNNNSIYFMEVEPVSGAPIFGDSSGKLYQFVLDKSTQTLPSTFTDGAIFIGNFGNNQYMGGARTCNFIAPYDDTTSLIITGGYNYNQARLFNGQY